MIPIILPFPPSVNHTWKRSGSSKQMYSTDKVREFHKEVCEIVNQYRLTNILTTFTGRLSVKMKIHAKDNRKRDIDNYFKSVADALTKNKVWEDDSQIDELIITRGEIDKANPRVVVTINPLV